jgi:hypothetical protein
MYISSAGRDSMGEVATGIVAELRSLVIDSLKSVVAGGVGGVRVWVGEWRRNKAEK